MCSYCGCRSISVIGRFMDEHEDCINLLGDVKRAVAAGDQARVDEALHALAHALDPHFTAEEVGLFDEMRRDEEFTDHIDRLCGEHTHLHAQMDALRRGDLSGYQDFEDLLYNHIDREENGLFPAAAIALDGPQWEAVVERTPGMTPEQS